MGMEDTRSVRLDQDELDGFLGSGGTGVLSFDTGGAEPPYSLPVSYGYDAETGNLYFRLSFGPGSGKPDLDGDPAVSFVVHEHTDDGWRSAVAVGTLERVAEVDVATGVLEELRRVRIPMVDAFDTDPRTLTFEFVRLVPDSLTGRKPAGPQD